MSESIPKQATAFALTREWIEWLRLNVGRGVSRPAIAEAMIKDGCAPDFATRLAESFTVDDAEDDNSTVRLAKVRWLLDSLRVLQGGSCSGKVPERETIDSSEFYDRFYPSNSPVVYRDCTSPAELAELLSFERLDEEFGDLEVEIQAGRSAESEFERKSDSLKSIARFGDFLRRVREASESNDFYMTANNTSGNAALLEASFDLSSICPDLLDGSKARGRVFLWIGPCGTFTPAHHDLTNNLFMQVQGSKEVRLAPSLALLELDNDRHCYLASNLSENDERRRAMGMAPLSSTVELNAGDILFIPLGWWHEVRGLSASISVSATNFRARNDFHRNYKYFGSLDA